MEYPYPVTKEQVRTLYHSLMGGTPSEHVTQALLEVFILANKAYEIGRLNASKKADDIETKYSDFIAQSGATLIKICGGEPNECRREAISFLSDAYMDGKRDADGLSVEGGDSIVSGKRA